MKNFIETRCINEIKDFTNATSKQVHSLMTHSKDYGKGLYFEMNEDCEVAFVITYLENATFKVESLEWDVDMLFFNFNYSK